jgi:hypothetical protein
MAYCPLGALDVTAIAVRPAGRAATHAGAGLLGRGRVMPLRPAARLTVSRLNPYSPILTGPAVIEKSPMQCPRCQHESSAEMVTKPVRQPRPIDPANGESSMRRSCSSTRTSISLPLNYYSGESSRGAQISKRRDR